MTQIIPAILPESFNDLISHVSRVRKHVSRVQIDIANGSYAPSKTWPYTSPAHFSELVSQDEGLPFWEDIEYEVDMLIAHPEEVVDDWISAGASGLIFHIETFGTKDYSHILQNVKMKGVEVGLGIKPSTPIKTLFPYLDMIDFIQCMGNDRIGFHGVELDEKVYEKLKEIRKTNTHIPIAVDIGVTEEIAPLLIQAGATKLVAGSAIFDSPDIKETLNYFKYLDNQK